MDGMHWLSLERGLVILLIARKEQHARVDINNKPDAVTCVIIMYGAMFNIIILERGMPPSCLK